MSNKRNSKIISIILISVCIMISLGIIPFSTGFCDGIIPDADSIGKGVFYILNKCVENEKELRYVTSRGTLYAAFFDLCLLVSAVYGRKGFIVISALGGWISLLICLIRLINMNGFDKIFDLDDCGLTIGFWIPFILFIICFFISLSISSYKKCLEINNLL